MAVEDLMLVYFGHILLRLVINSGFNPIITIYIFIKQHCRRQNYFMDMNPIKQLLRSNLFFFIARK